MAVIKTRKHTLSERMAKFAAHLENQGKGYTVALKAVMTTKKQDIILVISKDRRKIAEVHCPTEIHMFDNNETFLLQTALSDLPAEVTKGKVINLHLFELKRRTGQKKEIIGSTES